MRIANRIQVFVFFGLSASLAISAGAQDWPHWLGDQRDGAASAFDAPDDWPAELTQTWKVTVGEGVATPALVGDRIYVFARQDGQEVTRSLNAATGEEYWKDQYPSAGASGPASGFSGPRASPAVANGKVVTLGVDGIASCLDAETGSVVWRKSDFEGSTPRFSTSSSPLIADGLCVFQVGSDRDGGIVAYDLNTGDEKWKWMGDGPAYASLALATVDGGKHVVAMTSGKIVGVSLADGALLWETPFAPAPRSYNAATPVVHDNTVIYTGAGRGTTAIRIEKSGDGFSTQPLWNNADNAVQYNTPVLSDDLLFALSADNSLYCLNAENGETAWTAPIEGRRGFGTITAAGPFLMGLTPTADLVVFAASAEGFQKVASYKVSDSETYAFPVVSGSRVITKDADSVTLWSLN